MKKLPPIWETERMIMREITEMDADFIIALRSDPNVYKYFLAPHPLKKQEHIKWFKESYLNNSDQSCYIARLKLTDLPVGVFSAIKIDLHKMEIGYILSPEAQRAGLATEALAGMENLCRRNSDINTLIAQIHTNNMPSIRLVMRLGYVQREHSGDFVIYQKRL